jgi:tetratricopeptide (TPR) repeat protein
MFKDLFSGNSSKSRKGNIKQKDLIKLYDKKGNEMLVPKDSYRNEILPKQVEDAWNNSDSLYNVIIFALKDGFFDEINDATARLHEIDKDAERSYTVRSILLMKIGKSDIANELLSEYIKIHGKTGVIMTNLAKTYAEQGDHDTAEQLLWESLTIDPNQGNALDWWGAISFERGGKEAFMEAMKKVEAVKGSWRPQLFIAQYYLERKELARAKKLYTEVLSVAQNEPEVMMMISGDLGKNGYLQESISIIRPRYDPIIHGPFAGLNLLQAYLELGDFKNGEQLIDEIRKLNRYDIEGNLKHYQHSFAKLRKK